MQVGFDTLNRVGVVRFGKVYRIEAPTLEAATVGAQKLVQDFQQFDIQASQIAFLNKTQEAKDIFVCTDKDHEQYTRLQGEVKAMSSQLTESATESFVAVEGQQEDVLAPMEGFSEKMEALQNKVALLQHRFRRNAVLYRVNATGQKIASV